MSAKNIQHSWNGQELYERKGWRIEVGARLDQDLERLLVWADDRADPLACLEAASLRLPGFDKLAARTGVELAATGPGAGGTISPRLTRAPHSARAHSLAAGALRPAPPAAASSASSKNWATLVKSGIAVTQISDGLVFLLYTLSAAVVATDIRMRRSGSPAVARRR